MGPSLLSCPHGPHPLSFPSLIPCSPASFRTTNPPPPTATLTEGWLGIWFPMCLLLDSYAEGSLTLQRLPGEGQQQSQSVRSALYKQTHRGRRASVSICAPLTPPMTLCNTHRPSTQMWSQGFRYTHQDEHFQTQVKGERIAQ